MHPIKAWLWTLKVIFALLSFAVQCIGADVSNRALAEAAAVRVRLQIGKNHADLKDTNRFNAEPHPAGSDLETRLLNDEAIRDLNERRFPVRSDPAQDQEIERVNAVNTELMKQHKDLSSQVDQLQAKVEAAEKARIAESDQVKFLTVNVCNDELCNIGPGYVIETGEDWSLVQTAAHLSDPKAKHSNVTIQYGSQTFNVKEISLDRKTDVAIYRIDAALPLNPPPSGPAMSSMFGPVPNIDPIRVQDPYETPKSSPFPSGETTKALPPIPIEDVPPPRELPSGKPARGKFPFDYSAPGPLMRMETIMPSAESPIPQTSFKRHAIVYTNERNKWPGWCVACNDLKRRWGSGNADIEIEYSSEAAPTGPTGSYPQIRFEDDHGKWTWPAVRTNEGIAYQTITDLNALVRKIDANTTRYNRSYEASGVAGKIHAADKIRQGQQYFRQYIGEGNSVSILWNHSQGKVNLLAKSMPQLREIIGTTGRLQVNSPRAIGLPVKEMALNYQLIGKDVKLNMEPFTVLGLVDKISLDQSNVVRDETQVVGSGATPVGIIGIDDALLLYNIIAMCRDIFALLHPSADLMLPDEIAMTITLNGDTFTVDSDKPISAKLTWLFSMTLVVHKVTVSPSNVHLGFGNSSYWVKSRDFSVD